MPSSKRIQTSSARPARKAVPLRYKPEFCERLLCFFDVPPFTVTEVQKKDGSVAFVETAAELPTFASFAKQLGTTCEVLSSWEKKHPAFLEAAQKARDLQSNILIQNSLRGNYSASFAVFTAKNLLGWKDGKEDMSPSSITVHWEEKE